MLYIDESGDEGIYHPSYALQNIVGGSSRYFTLGGIIIKDKDKSLFKKELDTIVSESLINISLPNDFKLHYFELRDARYPYDKLSKEERLEIANKVFRTIVRTDCKLLSITLDIHFHCTKYSIPFSPRAYALFLILERFQYFLVDYNESGEVVYERYNSPIRKNVELLHAHLKENPSFPKYTHFDNILGGVKDGDPLLEPVLQFADFFAYIPFLKRTSSCKKLRRWNQIKHKYYNFDHPDYRKRGNYEV